MNPQRCLTDFENRFHLDKDVDATELDCFTVTLPPLSDLPMLVYRKGAPMEALYGEAKAMLTTLREQCPRTGYPPRKHFEPFGIITARSFADVWREHETKMAMLLGGVDGEKLNDLAKRYPAQDMTQFHEQRVAHLNHALDLMRGHAQPPVTVPWTIPERFLN